MLKSILATAGLTVPLVMAGLYWLLRIFVTHRLSAAMEVERAGFAKELETHKTALADELEQKKAALPNAHMNWKHGVGFTSQWVHYDSSCYLHAATTPVALWPMAAGNLIR